MLTYDAENRVISVTKSGYSATFMYDGDGNRIKATVAGTTTTFIGNWFEWSDSQSTKVRYYYGGGKRIAMRVGSGTTTSTLTYLFGDHLGSTSLTYKADTGATTTQLYKPWGGRKRETKSSRFRVRYQSGTLPTDYTYTGQYSHTDDFGLMYYVARWYDPTLGRFAQADTIVPGAGSGNASSISQVASQMYTALTTGYYESPIISKLNQDNLFIRLHGGLINLDEETKKRGNIVNVTLNVQGFDRYSYAENNPVNNADPTGHSSGGNFLFGYEENGNILHIWFLGEEMWFNLDEVSKTTLAKLIDFKIQADAFSGAINDMFIDAGIAASSGVIFFATIAEMIITAPDKTVPFYGQAKLAVEIVILLASAGIAVFEIANFITDIGNAIDAYKDLKDDWEYLKNPNLTGVIPNPSP